MGAGLALKFPPNVLASLRLGVCTTYQVFVLPFVSLNIFMTRIRIGAVEFSKVSFSPPAIEGVCAHH